MWRIPKCPTLGDLGAINYNPELISRQARYPIIRAPLEETIMPFVIHGSEAHKGEHHRKIRHAWKNETKSYGASPSYREWLKGRTKLVGLPCGEVQYQNQKAQTYEVQETLRVGELEETLEQMKTEQGLEAALEEVRLEKQLKDKTNKRARAKKETRLKVGSFLRATDQEMCSRRAERNQIAIEKEQLKEALLNLKTRETKWEKHVHGLQEKVRLLEELARAKLSKEYLEDQRRQSLFELVKARGKSDEAELQSQATIQELKGGLRKLETKMPRAR
ncbi:hypothetical protein CR513_14324, partial [Mucuna pruriens]